MITSKIKKWMARREGRGETEKHAGVGKVRVIDSEVCDDCFFMTEISFGSRSTFGSSNLASWDVLREKYCESVHRVHGYFSSALSVVWEIRDRSEGI